MPPSANAFMADQRTVAAGEIAMAFGRLIRIDLLAFILDQVRVDAEQEAGEAPPD